VVSSPELARWVGVGVCLLGVACAIWSRRTLGRNWSSKVEFKKDHELIESGPYRFVRHPIYTSILIMDVGTALCVGDLAAWVGALCMGCGFCIKLRQEEVVMMRHFSTTYPAYKQRVKALIPFVF
jgi:protein-S-isoprenylcysteine O-methyltransferase Ste14